MLWRQLLLVAMDKRLVSIKKLLLGILLIFSVAGNCHAESTVSISKTYVIPSIILPKVNVNLGGISDLVAISEDEFYVITDRGPNGKIQTDDGKFRTLLSPDFRPIIAKIAINKTLDSAYVKNYQYIKGQLGYCTGKPDSDRVDTILNSDGTKVIEPDIDGIDPEGLVQLSNGSFIITEEYGPSILIGEDRFYLLPERRDNRGLEAVSLSPDEKYLWTMLQSPTDIASKNIPFVIFDLENKNIARLLYYRLEDDAEDGKVCCMSTLDDHTVLVLEQSDTTNAAFYKFDLNNQSKELFARLDNILPQMASDITNGEWQPKSGELITGLKIEGMALLDKNTIAVVNDNDFYEEKNNCLWILKFSVDK